MHGEENACSADNSEDAEANAEIALSSLASAKSPKAPPDGLPMTAPQEGVNQEVPVVRGGGGKEGGGKDFVSTGKVNELLSKKNSPPESYRRRLSSAMNSGV